MCSKYPVNLGKAWSRSHSCGATPAPAAKSSYVAWGADRKRFNLLGGGSGGNSRKPRYLSRVALGAGGALDCFFERCRTGNHAANFL